MTPRNHAIDSTSRVISFVLGFALASLIAWLGSIRGDEIATTNITEAVAAAVPSVVTPATEEKIRVPPAQPLTTLETAPPPAKPPQSQVQAASWSVLQAPARPAQPQTAPAAVRGYRGRLALSSTPEGAEVVVNGMVVGQTPVELEDLPVGSSVVVVRREGYSSWSGSVRIVANERTTVKATLVPYQHTGG